MSLFPHAHNTPIHIQDSTLTAVRGDQINLSTFVAGSQNSYFANPPKSASSTRLSYLCLT